MIGQTVGPYKIVEKLGEGGMGEVFRARDARLNRDVALKLLPAALAGDAERLARFRREAQVLAALNHPNVAHLYGFEESAAGAPALVMELVEGQTLAEILKAQGPGPGALGLSEALAIAKQIADALEAAHEQGIVHRDLKPANIKVRADGTVKVLDFGLAKALDADVSRATADAMNSPTLTAAFGTVQMGMILGTAAYMAPEQAKGKLVDKRADIWAFGVVFYEMLTGTCPFIAETIPETLAQVITREIDVTTLPAGTPPQVRKLIARCLEKDPKQRLRDIGDARLILGDKDERDDAKAAARALPPPFMARFLLPTALVLFAFAAIGLVLAYQTRGNTVATPVHLSIALPQGEQVTTVPAISPDGRTVAYAAGRSLETSQLYLRSLDSFEARAVPSSAGASLPFFSPDGQSVGFFAGGKLWRVLVAGGAPQSIVAAPRAWGGAWRPDGTIVYVPNLTLGMWSIPETGGTPVQITKPDGAAAGYAHAYPQSLPGTNDLLFSFWGQTFYTAAFSASSRTWRPVLPPLPVGGGRTSAIYSPNGYLVASDGVSAMTAVAWDPSVMTPRNPQTIVIDSVYSITGAERGWFNVSESGTAVWAPGSPGRRRLVWVDRHGVATVVPGDPDTINGMAVSRDGKRIVRHGRMSQWIEDLTAGTHTRIVSDLITFVGGWLPDGRVVLSSNKEGNWDLYSVNPNGSGQLTPLLKRPYVQHPMSIASDGSVVFLETHPETSLDLWMMAPDGTTRPLLVTPFNESAAALSADDKHVAYVSDASGRSEVYVMPVSGTEERVAVSTDGGSGPVWSRDGRELFYRAGDHLMSVEVTSHSPLTLGARKELLDVSAYEFGYFHDFDVSPDGQRFLFIRAEPDARPTRLDVVTHWFQELEQKVKK